MRTLFKSFRSMGIVWLWHCATTSHGWMMVRRNDQKNPHHHHPPMMTMMTLSDATSLSSSCLTQRHGWWRRQHPCKPHSTTSSSFSLVRLSLSQRNNDDNKYHRANEEYPHRDNDDHEEDEEDEENTNTVNDNASARTEQSNRMQVVRSLQACFYQPSAARVDHRNNNNSDCIGDTPAPTLDLTSGMFYHLPLWRVPWNEVPGRTNVLHVHDGMYTHMFETILHQSPPWYVGHLYLPSSAAAVSAAWQQEDNNSNNTDKHDFVSHRHRRRASSPKLKLSSWDAKVAAAKAAASSQAPVPPNHHYQQHLPPHDTNNNKDTTTTTDMEDDDDQSAVVGTLLRIADYRRMADGRLLLLVQAMVRNRNCMNLFLFACILGELCLCGFLVVSDWQTSSHGTRLSLSLHDVIMEYSDRNGLW